MCEENCSVCIEPLIGLVHKLECTHTFHCECLHRSMKHTCPLCRTPYDVYKVLKTKYEHYNSISNIISTLYTDLSEPDVSDLYKFNDKMDKRTVRFYLKEELDILKNKIDHLNITDEGVYNFKVDKDTNIVNIAGYDICDMFDILADLFVEFINDDDDYETLTRIQMIMYNRGLLRLSKYISLYSC